MCVCVSEEEGFREHFGDEGGVSTMSVRINPELSGRNGEPLINTSRIYLYDY